MVALACYHPSLGRLWQEDVTLLRLSQTPKNKIRCSSRCLDLSSQHPLEVLHSNLGFQFRESDTLCWPTLGSAQRYMNKNKSKFKQIYLGLGYIITLVVECICTIHRALDSILSTSKNKQPTPSPLPPNKNPSR